MQNKLDQIMSQCQILYNNRPLERVRHGKKMTLKDHGIKSSTTLVVTKLGITLNVTNPKVMTIISIILFFVYIFNLVHQCTYEATAYIVYTMQVHNQTTSYVLVLFWFSVLELK